MARQARRILTEWTFDGNVSEQRDFYLPVDVLELYIDYNLRRTYLSPNTPEKIDDVVTPPKEPIIERKGEEYLPSPTKEEIIAKKSTRQLIEEDRITTADPIDRGYTPIEKTSPRLDLDVGSGDAKVESEGLDYIPTKEPSGSTIEYDAGITNVPTAYTDSGSEYVPPPRVERISDEAVTRNKEIIYHDKEEGLLESEVMAEKSVSTGSTDTGDIVDVTYTKEVDTGKVDYTSGTRDLDVSLAPESPTTEPSRLDEEHVTVSTTTDPIEDVVDVTAVVTQEDRRGTFEPVEETIYVESSSKYSKADDSVRIEETISTSTDSGDVADIVSRPTSTQGLATPPPSQPTLDVSIGDVTVPEPSPIPTRAEPVPVSQPIKEDRSATISTSAITSASTVTKIVEDVPSPPQPPAPKSIVYNKPSPIKRAPTRKRRRRSSARRDRYSVEPLVIKFFIDGRESYTRVLNHYPSQLNEIVQIILPSALKMGKHVIGIKVSTPRAIYKGDVKIEYELPAVMGWSSDKPPEVPDLPTVPTPPEIPDPLMMITNWWNGVLATLGTN